MTRISHILAGLALWAPVLVNAQTPDEALLVVAHGADRGTWNERVIHMVDRVEWAGPKGVAFLTPASPEQELKAVAARLDRNGVKRILVVPLLISSFSDHYEEIRYYAGARQNPPEHVENEPLHTKAELVVTGAMDGHPLLARILADQLRTVSRDPGAESVILVAHGPNDDGDNQKWLAHLRAHANFLQEAAGFKRVEFATLRDDAPQAVKDAAVAALRERIRQDSEDSAVLVQPVLISTGHVQQEIAKLLTGLTFKMSASGVSEHELAPVWVRQQGLSAERAGSAAPDPQ